MRRALSLAGGIGPIAAALLAAQGRPALEARLDRETGAAVRAIIDSAGRDSVPSRPLENKALEGAAKRVPPPRIIAAVHQLFLELREALALLRASAPDDPISDGQIIAVADVRRRGVPAAELSALRRHVPATAPLVVSFTVMGDLVQRGVPAAEARRVIERLITAGAASREIAEVPARMDVGLRVGAPPLDALRGALPIPLRPGRPPGL